MTTRLKVATALSIVASMFTGVLAYSVHHGWTSTFIALPDESVQMVLVPISSKVERPVDSACCPNADRP